METGDGSHVVCGTTWDEEQQRARATGSRRMRAVRGGQTADGATERGWDVAEKNRTAGNKATDDLIHQRIEVKRVGSRTKRRR